MPLREDTVRPRHHPPAKTGQSVEVPRGRTEARRPPLQEAVLGDGIAAGHPEAPDWGGRGGASQAGGSKGKGPGAGVSLGAGPQRASGARQNFSPMPWKARSMYIRGSGLVCVQKGPLESMRVREPPRSP